MTELEQYIRRNAAAFDTETPAEGHEARFLARLDEAVGGPRPVGQRRSFRAFLFPAGGRFRRPAVWALAVACALLLVLVIRPGDPFRGVPNDPEAIYLAYMDRVADIYQALPAEGSAEWDDALQDLTEEEDPLYTQVPGELPRRQQGRILKQYYGELLAHARQFKNIR